MKKYFMILVLITFMTSLALAADDPFPKIDKNKDGKISKQEYMDAVRQNFDRLDKNHDSVLTKDELAHMDKKDLELFMEEADANHDGKILKEEYEQAAEKKFSIMDKNRDGSIDKKEWKTFQSSQKKPGLILFTF